MHIPHVKFDYMCEAAAAILIIGALLFAAGCNTTDRTTEDLIEPVQFEVLASDNEIIAGEVVTLSTRSANTLGRDAEIEWNTTGGELETQNNNRIARVRFDTPGTYIVSATLMVDGSAVRTDTMEVQVKPLIDQ